MFTRGNSFYGPLRVAGKTPHLWIVLHCDSDCDSGRLLWVNVTTFRDRRDESCILMPGDHPIITQKSIINYWEAQNPLIANIKEALSKGYLERQEPCTPMLIEKILNGAQVTRYMKDKFKRLCVK